eukprot:gene20376-biopygen19108
MMIQYEPVPLWDDVERVVPTPPGTTRPSNDSADMIGGGWHNSAAQHPLVPILHCAGCGTEGARRSAAGQRGCAAPRRAAPPPAERAARRGRGRVWSNPLATPGGNGVQSPGCVPFALSRFAQIAFGMVGFDLALHIQKQSNQSVQSQPPPNSEEMEPSFLPCKPKLNRTHHIGTNKMNTEQTTWDGAVDYIRPSNPPPHAVFCFAWRAQFITPSPQRPLWLRRRHWKKNGNWRTMWRHRRRLGGENEKELGEAMMQEQHVQTHTWDPLLGAVSPCERTRRINSRSCDAEGTGEFCNERGRRAEASSGQLKWSAFAQAFGRGPDHDGTPHPFEDNTFPAKRPKDITCNRVGKQHTLLFEYVVVSHALLKTASPQTTHGRRTAPPHRCARATTRGCTRAPSTGLFFGVAASSELDPREGGGGRQEA